MIITDANVWYDIAVGKYKDLDLSRLPLCLTALTLLEIGISKGREDRPELIIQTCKSIKKLNPFYIEYLPYEFVARRFGISIGKSIELRIVDDIINSIGLDRNMIQLNVKRKELFREDIKQFMNEGRVNSTLINMAKDEKLWLNAISRDFTLELENNLGIQREQFDKIKLVENGSRVNFYLFARAVYLRKLTLDSNYDVSRNDQFDLMNTMYVDLNDKYWTEDKKWRNNIIDAGMKEFLFDPSQNVQRFGVMEQIEL